MSNKASKPYLLVKIGGRPASDQAVLDALLADLAALQESYHPVLVHGGGAEVSEMSRKLGLEPQFVGGIRQTSAEEMQIVEAVLAGNVNSRLLRRALALGIKAIGLSGADAGLFCSQSIDVDHDSKTGKIVSLNIELLQDLCQLAYLPIISSISTDKEGTSAFNINADDAAMALAIALKVRTLVYVSDIPGILKDGNVIHKINKLQAEAEIAAGVISGGMIPKVRSSLAALESGVGTVIIAGFNKVGDLSNHISGKTGTSIVA